MLISVIVDYSCASTVLSDRDGKCGNPSVLQAVIKSLTEVESSKTQPKKIYEEILEDRFLSHTAEYYRIQADREIQNGDCSQYLEKVMQWMNDEVRRSTKFLQDSSITKLKDQCLKILVVDRMEYLLTEFEKLGPLERTKDYQNAYALLKSTDNGLDFIVSQFGEHVIKVGCDVMHSVKNTSPEVFVETFLQVREKYINMIKECFDSDEKFISALEKACVKILKCDEHKIFAGRSSEMLADYCDGILKRDSKDNDETVAEEALSQGFVVFSYIENKDLFQRLYTTKLAKRLLRVKTQFFHLEESMIAKLRQKCGYEFTKKWQDMLTDMHMKNTLNEDFSVFIQSNQLALGLDFDAAVLRTSSWPFSPITSSSAIPQALEKCVTEFEKFYFNKFKGRKLSWLHHVSTAELKLCYLNKPYIVSLSTYQMAILLLFEQTDQVTWSEMQENTKLDEEYLIKVTRSLTESKLIATAEENTNCPDVVYHLNKAFSSNRTKLKILPVGRKDRKEEKIEELQRTQESAGDSRRCFLNSIIVRIMKARRKLEHSALIEEVVKQVSDRFLPNILLIKKCIDSLIDRQYIERSPECMNEYIYIA